MRLVSAASLVCITFVLSGCGLLNLDPDVIVTARIASSAPDVLQKTIPILERRLSDRQAALNSAVEIQSHNDTLTIRIIGGAPEEKLIRQLVETRGEFSLREATSNGEPWITNSDISNVAAMFTEQRQAALGFKTSEAAGRRLREKTRNAIGKRLEFLIDGQSIMTASISGEFGEMFQLTMNSPAESMLYKNILSGPPLPAGIEVLSIETAAP